MFAKKKPLYCTACGSVGLAKTAVRGSVLVEFALWLLFCLPGIIYSVWRSSSRHAVCAACGAEGPIPVDSPVAKRALGTPYP